MKRGVFISVRIKDTENDKEYALGMTTDAFKDAEQAKRALSALCSSLQFSGELAIDGREITGVVLPFYIP